MRNRCFNINTLMFILLLNKHNCFSSRMKIGLVCFICTMAGFNLVKIVYNVLNFLQ